MRTGLDLFDPLLGCGASYMTRLRHLRLNCISSVALCALLVQKDKTLSNFPLSGLDTFWTLNFKRLWKVFLRSVPELAQAHGVAET